MEDKQCTNHNKFIKWTCASCNSSLCSDCNATAFQGKIYCRNCINKVEFKKVEAEDRDIPSIGIKIIGWWLVLGGVLSFLTAIVLFTVIVISGGIEFRGQTLGILTTIGIVLLAFLSSVIPFAIGVFLLDLDPRARKILMILSSLRILYSLFILIKGMTLNKLLLNVPLFSIFILWFFSRKKIKNQFTSSKSRRKL